MADESPVIGVAVLGRHAVLGAGNETLSGAVTEIGTADAAGRASCTSACPHAAPTGGLWCPQDQQACSNALDVDNLLTKRQDWRGGRQAAIRRCENLDARTDVGLANSQIMGNFILGLVTAVLIALLREVAKREMWGPRLSVEFRDTAEFKVQTTELVPSCQIETTPEEFLTGQLGPAQGPWTHVPCQAKYVRLRVINDGFDVAKNCYGYLVDVEKWDGGRFAAIGFHDTIPLCWSYLDNKSGQRIDIVRRVPQYLDVFSTRQGRRTITPRVATMPNVYQEIFRTFTQGRLRFSIVVAGEGAEPKRCTVEVEWNGDWENFVVHSTSLEEFDR